MRGISSCSKPADTAATPVTVFHGVLRNGGTNVVPCASAFVGVQVESNANVAAAAPHAVASLAHRERDRGIVILEEDARTALTRQHRRLDVGWPTKMQRRVPVSTRHASADSDRAA